MRCTTRVVLLLTISLCTAYTACAQTSAAPEDARPWFERCLVGMEVGTTGAQFGYSDLHETIYASRFNGHDIVEHAVSADVEYLVIWARDGDWAYYDSKVARKCPGLGARDVLLVRVQNEPGQLGRVLAALAARNLNIEYGYSSGGPDDEKGLVLVPSDMEAALEALTEFTPGPR